ncbi:MAG: polymerase [Candidatus Syntrophoarchaeum caldarius]|uniref:Polymerase n=1 Tax=Candidatus Syntropharchaeum caldarium TaxID=1838285 RepID=A0A1F2P7Q3_9EURY|nr:MAG: polymerase [Candidatus Syntrophoarchaeum caldarius]
MNVTLFVEGSHGDALKRTVVKSLIVIFSLLVPAAALVLRGARCRVCGWRGWGAAGDGCRESVCREGLPPPLPLHPTFASLSRIFFAIKRIQKDVKELVVLSGLVFGLVVGLGYLFMTMFGVVGVGVAWVVGNGVGSVCVGVMVWREGWV